jgi:histidine triad (HIT) family protein
MTWKRSFFGGFSLVAEIVRKNERFLFNFTFLNGRLHIMRGDPMKDQITIFDKILAKEIPADIVYEDEHVLSFKDINPGAPVHVLVIPKKKIASFNDIEKLKPEEAGAFLHSVGKVAKKLNLKNGYRVVINCGEDGGQSVDYIHAHILGKRQLDWPPG